MWYEDPKWWKLAFSRALRSLAQGALTGGIGSAAIMSDVNWKYCVSSAVIMFVVSIFTSIALGIPEYKGDEEK